MKVAIASFLVLIAGSAFACPGDKSASATAPVSAKEASQHAAAERAKAAKRAQTIAQVKTPTQTITR